LVYALDGDSSGEQVRSRSRAVPGRRTAEQAVTLSRPGGTVDALSEVPLTISIIPNTHVCVSQAAGWFE
jgi:hypothetical protein